MTKLVVVENLTKSFAHKEKDVHVLRGIDLEIEQGEMLCVVGLSGAGKSTLLHILGTLDLPTSGRILFDGRDITHWSSGMLAEFRNRSLGFVFQFHHLLPEFNALENVMMPGLIRGVSRGPLAKLATDLLTEVGLAHRLTHRPGELSGGEQQRVALARALVMGPKLVLADEPTGNLDSTTSDAINRLFFELNQSRGTTFLIVTHNRELAARMPRVLTMKDGQIERDERRPGIGAYRRVGEAPVAVESAESEPASEPESAPESADAAAEVPPDPPEAQDPPPPADEERPL
jgi:lipoprotein-releasing system ATP-binding protein